MLGDDLDFDAAFLIGALDRAARANGTMSSTDFGGLR
jgi:hypothetical protein